MSTAREEFWNWVAESPASQQASEALYYLLLIEDATGRDFGGLRNQYISLADSAQRAYPELWWSARQMAVQCLLRQNDYENGLAEYRSLAELAPTELEGLFLEQDILGAEEAFGVGDPRDGKTDAIRNVRQSRRETAARIENLLAQQDDRQAAMLPSDIGLNAIYPNPFNGSVRILFALPEAAYVSLSVYDLSGRLVESLVDQPMEAGSQGAVWKSESAPTGQYYLRLEAGKVNQTKQITLVK